MKINISAIAKFLPKNCISSQALDKAILGRDGKIEKVTGVKYRHHVSENESVCQMGAEALLIALTTANVKPADIDLLIYCGASFDYPVPHNSVIIKSKITDDSVKFNCFDVDSTCLSFLNALDVAHLYLQAGRYKRIAIVCSEVASKSLSFNDENVFGLFGDAAVALIVETSEVKGYTPTYVNFLNYPSGAFYAQVPLGGVVEPGFKALANDPGHYFKMDGKRLVKLTVKYIEAFVKDMESKIKYKINDFDRIIAHQTSKFGNEFFVNKFNIDITKTVETLSIYGNCISASIPLGLELFINQSYNTTSKKILLIGTGAGLTIGCIVLEFD
jgi:3-oxoacyl-[acyl-carrier-protein] synthase-3